MFPHMSRLVMLEEDSTHVMIKVMLPIICLRNHNSKITGASPMLYQVPCYIKFHVMIFDVKSYVTKHEF